MTTGVGMRAGLLETAVTVSVCASLVAPEVMPVRETVWVTVPRLKAILAGVLRVGASFTGDTVTTNVRVTMLLEEPPSFTLTVMVAEPDFVATGAIVRVPVAPGLV